MVSCRLRPFVRIFLLFCLVAMICQQTFLHGLILGVKGETTLTSNGSIDLYTQKEPYSGRGKGQPSDAFAPQELVILYAYVTYNLYPVQNKIVAFQIIGPPNSIYNFSIIMSSQTNGNGIAQMSFRIPWPDENAETQIFGNWTAIATVDIAGQTVMDTLTFQVGWIVRLLKVETVDVNNVSRTSFTKDERVCFKLTVRNIAMTGKIATLIIDVYDNSSFPLGQLIVENVWMSPGVNVFFIKDLLIPTWACPGVSLVVANAYTKLPSVDGKPWCPQVSTTFLIAKLIVHDVAVLSVSPSSNIVYIGEILDINVTVKNQGNCTESFNVTAFYNSNVIGTLPIKDLEPNGEILLVFRWNTQNVAEGNYTLSAEASVVLEEINLENNRFVDGVVWVKLGMLPIAWEIPRWLLALLFLLAIFIGACLAAAIVFAFLWRRCRKKKDQIDKQPTRPEVEFKKSKTCSVCGKEFPGVYTFCPYCFTFHGKDYE